MSEIEIIVGFRGSGKTLFLNSYLNMKNIENSNRILILILDKGNVNVQIGNRKNVKVKVIDSPFEINDKKLLYLISIHKPHFIFIEGDYSDIKNIGKILNSDLLIDRIFISSRINIINQRHISKVLKYRVCKTNSNIIVINNHDRYDIDSNDLYNIKNRNKNAFVFCVNEFGELYEKFKLYKILRNEFYKSIVKYIKDLI